MQDAQLKKKGKKKIQMIRIEREADRLVTFSKRRFRIYKKATEISTLCAIEVGILMFFPSQKPYSYGVPNIETITRRLMNMEVGDDNNIGEGVVEAFRRVKMEDLNRSCDQLTMELRRLKNEGVMLANETKEKLRESGEHATSWWWDILAEDLNIVETEKMIVTMKETEKMIVTMEEMKSVGYRLCDLALVGSTSSSFNPIQIW